jgi:8-oxoguanine DNA-glycosylase Ogg
VQSGSLRDLSREDLDLTATLNSGQMFRWSRDADGAWCGVIEGRRRARLAQSEDFAAVHYEADGADPADAERTVRRLLRLDDLDLPARAEEWCRADSLFAEAWTRHPGLRLLRQDPEECFFSFLCASVAPIARISGMLRAVAAEWGTYLDATGRFVAFPGSAELAGAEESRLRELGLGFRARRVAEAARRLRELPAGLLPSLRAETHGEAKRELTGFFGVGEKIADCVCLFSLDKDGAVPVDVHIWRVAQARYAPQLAGKSLTAANYARAVQGFHDTFGPDAGWAQQTLFYRAAVGGRRRTSDAG